ncbi:MAG: recombinase family protein [Oscillospiraceae bacterium]|nr:recombinase family protein [Oscillospiraceae bacterium]
MKAVIYARYSSDNQREESIEGQLRECREYAEKNDIRIIETYVDRALSASKDTEKRLEFQRMIKDSAKGQFKVVLVWKLDRFARSRYDSAHYKNVLKRNGVKVVSVTERIADGPEGIILESMLEGMAEYYSAELSEKIHRGQKENALKGKNNGGGIPLGYLLGDNQKLEVDPLTAPIVLEIFQRYAGGETVRTIIESLNGRGLQTKRNKPYSMGSFNALLKNRKYIGEYSYQDIVIPGGVPSIVPEDLFNRVQTKIEKNRRAPARTKAAEEFLLTTKLFCGKCGRMMVGESGTSHTGRIHYYYKCGAAKRKKGCDKKAVKRDWIENLVVQRTANMILDDALMERLINKLLDAQGKEKPDIAILRKQLSETENGIENLLNAIQAGIVTTSTKKRLESLEALKSETETSLTIAELKNPTLTREQISYFIYRFRKLDITVPEHRQRLIDSFVNAVYVFDDKLVLTYNYKDGTETIPLDTVKGSDFVGSAPP